MDAFLGASFWFDEGEKSIDKDHYEPFERKRFVKEELFKANAESVEGRDGAFVRAADLATTLRLPAKTKATNYHSFIFAKVQR